PHTAGIAVRGPVAGLLQLEPSQEFPGAGTGGLPFLTVKAADHVEVLVSGQVLVHGGVLAGQSDRAPHTVGVGEDVPARHPCLPRVGFEQGGQNPDHSGFAGTVRTQQAEHLAGGDVEVDPVERTGRAVGLDQPPRAHRDATIGLRHAATLRAQRTVSTACSPKRLNPASPRHSALVAGPSRPRHRSKSACQRSRMAVMTCPPAAQTEIRPRPEPFSASSLARVAATPPPVAANGAPAAMDEPCTFSLDRSIAPGASSRPSRSLATSLSSQAFNVVSTCEANASWIS